jgi:hypothetical protein
VTHLTTTSYREDVPLDDDLLADGEPEKEYRAANPS